MKEILESIGVDGFTILPSGSWATVILITKGSIQQVIKIFPRNLVSETGGELDDLGKDILDYNRTLGELGVLVADQEHVTYQVIQKNSDPVLVLQMPFLGEDFERQIKEGKISAIQATQRILENIYPLFKSEHLEVGIDPKPANFVGKGWYIDLTPSRIWKNGVPVLEWYSRISDNVTKLAYHRHYTVTGVILVLQDQISRLAPQSRPEIKRVIRDFLHCKGLSKPEEYLTQAPWESFLSIPKCRRDDHIDSLTPTDMYVMREIASEATSKDALPLEALEQVFTLTHLHWGELMSGEKLIQVQNILRGISEVGATPRSFVASAVS